MRGNSVIYIPEIRSIFRDETAIEKNQLVFFTLLVDYFCLSRDDILTNYVASFNAEVEQSMSSLSWIIPLQFCETQNSVITVILDPFTV